MAFQQLKIPANKVEQVKKIIDQFKLKTSFDYEKNGFLYITFRGDNKGVQKVIKITSIDTTGKRQ